MSIVWGFLAYTCLIYFYIVITSDIVFYNTARASSLQLLFLATFYFSDIIIVLINSVYFNFCWFTTEGRLGRIKLWIWIKFCHVEFYRLFFERCSNESRISQSIFGNVHPIFIRNQGNRLTFSQKSAQYQNTNDPFWNSFNNRLRYFINLSETFVKHLLLRFPTPVRKKNWLYFLGNFKKLKTY